MEGETIRERDVGGKGTSDGWETQPVLNMTQGLVSSNTARSGHAWSTALGREASVSVWVSCLPVYALLSEMVPGDGRGYSL